ncbi:hypothetical protein RSAG8_04883, partial [Rhizoctonia solani AG-8 WAC10335]
MLLYSDLLIMISEYLREDPGSLYHLCLTCRYAHATVTQILYQRVQLHRARTIEMFCTTILEGSASLHSIPQYLWVGPAHYGRHSQVVYLVSRLRRTLNLLPNLRALTFTPTAKSFGEIYAGLLECPFKLQNFTAPYQTNLSFVQFLQSQPSIETLRLHDPDTEPPRALSIVKHINELLAQGTLLPNLKLLAADPRVLSALAVDRPISHIEISVGSCCPCEEETLSGLVEALARTSVPLASLKHNLGNLRIHFGVIDVDYKKSYIGMLFLLGGISEGSIWLQPLVIASGLNVGKEGPSVHVACCIGNVVARMFSGFSHSQGKMREILTAASAAGVAVAFGSPIGGVMFSIEEMSSTFSIKTMWRSFFCALVATVTLSAMNPFRTGKLVLFQVTYDRDWHFFEIIFFIIIGIFGGLYGVLVVKFNLQVAAFRRKHLVGYGVEEAVFLATITAIVSYFNRFLRIDMSESLGILFKECEGGGDYDNLCQSWAQWPMANSLFLATVVRIVLVIISYGGKVPAGIFVPSMAIGATFGRMIGIIVKAITYPTSSFFSSCRPDIPCITPGTYALLGAAAALSGIMRITVSVVVIMFELTGALTYILPTMIVILVTKAVGDCFEGGGIADEMIRFNGYPYLERDDHAFNIPVSQVMQKELYTMSVTGMTLREVEEKLEHTSVQGFPIVSTDSQRILVGYIGRTELRYVIGKARSTQDIHPSTLCSFESPSESQSYHTATDTDMVRELVGVEEDDHAGITPLAASADTMHFGPWVNQTPLCVAPQLPLEIVMDLFKRMGPRVILVEYQGSLTGLITVKDVLRFMVSSEHAHPASRSVWDNQGELDALLEEAWLWAGNIWGKALAMGRRIIRR